MSKPLENVKIHASKPGAKKTTRDKLVDAIRSAVATHNAPKQTLVRVSDLFFNAHFLFDFFPTRVPFSEEKLDELIAINKKQKLQINLTPQTTADRGLMVAMALHHRVGAQSPLHLLSADLLRGLVMVALK